MRYKGWADEYIRADGLRRTPFAPTLEANLWYLTLATSWTDKREFDVERALAGKSYRINDVTGQPAEQVRPEPNILVVEVFTDDAGYKAILSHVDYGEGAVYTAEVLE